MDLATAIAAAQAVFAIMNVLSSRGDGSLSANSQAIRKKLGVNADGLVAVQDGITRLSRQIGALKKEVDELPYRIYILQCPYRLRACVGIFVEETGGGDRP